MWRIFNQKWLEHNEVYFRTIAAFLLSIMAILLSIFECRNSSSQLELSKVQTELAMHESLPHLNISCSQVWSDSLNCFANETIVVENLRGYQTGFDCNEMTFLRIEIFNATSVVVDTCIPIMGYYGIQYVSNSTEGRLARLVGNDNVYRLVNLERELRTLLPQTAFASLSIRQFVSVSYLDITQNRRQRTFKVAGVSGAIALSESSADTIKEEYKLSYPTEFEGLSAARLLELVGYVPGP